MSVLFISPGTLDDIDDTASETNQFTDFDDEKYDPVEDDSSTGDNLVSQVFTTSGTLKLQSRYVIKCFQVLVHFQERERDVALW